MELAFLITNICLVILTCIYVLLTHKLSKQSAKNNIINQSFYQEQIRLSCIPLFSVNTPKQESEFDIELYVDNIGSFPAYDLDIWFLSTVNNEDFSRNKLRKFVKGEKNKKEFRKLDSNELAEGDFYALFDRGFYPTLQTSHRIKLKSTFVLYPYSLDLLIQYKDHIGNNYYQHYCLSYTDDKKHRLIVDDRRPDIIKPIEKFTLIKPVIDKVNNEITIEKGDNLPKELDYLYKLIKAGINGETLINEKISAVENRWEIERI